MHRRTTIHYTYNNWALANGTGREVVKQGGKTWFFITADYAFGKSLEEDTSAVVKAAGGKVLGAVQHPSPGTTDFSSYLLQAQASGAQDHRPRQRRRRHRQLHQAGERVRHHAEAEAGRPARLHLRHPQPRAARPRRACTSTTAFYWDLDDDTRKWSKRFQSHPDNKKKSMPTMVQAGVYSAVTHYLKAIKAAGTDDADAVIAKMKEMPVNDFFAKNGQIGPDGLHRHDMYLVQVKTPGRVQVPLGLLQDREDDPRGAGVPDGRAAEVPARREEVPVAPWRRPSGRARGERGPRPRSPMQALFGQLLLGLINGSFYALLSLGLAIIFGLLDVVNFAHGALYMLGAFVAWMGLTYLGIGYWPALLLAPVRVGLARDRRSSGPCSAGSTRSTTCTASSSPSASRSIVEGLFHEQYGNSGSPYPVPELLQGGVRAAASCTCPATGPGWWWSRSSSASPAGS